MGFYTSDNVACYERMRIQYDGNVGIGTTAPTNKLTIDGGITIMPTISATYEAGSLGFTNVNWGFLYRPPRVGAVGAHAFYNYAGNKVLMNIEDAGNVGIGTTYPYYKLDVDGNVGITSLSASTERIITTSGTSELQNYLEIDTIIIVDSSLIVALQTPQNWTGGTYEGTIINAIDGQYYVGDYYKYEFDNSEFKRYEFADYPTFTITEDTTGSTYHKNVVINSTGGVSYVLGEASTMVFDEIHITNINTGTVTIIPTTSTIMGETSQLLGQWESMHLKRYENNYIIQ